MIPYCRQDVLADDIDAVTAVLRSDFLTQGPEVAALGARLRARGIGVNLHYIPVPRQPYYRSLGHRASDFPEAERYYAEAISLPVYPAMTEEQMHRVIEAVRGVLVG